MDEKIFKAYCRKLYRVLEKLDNAIDEEKYEYAKELIEELMDDTQDDINE